MSDKIHTRHFQIEMENLSKEDQTFLGSVVALMCDPDYSRHIADLKAQRVTILRNPDGSLNLLPVFLTTLKPS